MKRLIIRLSSLGDLILSQAALEVPYPGETHWLVAKEYESLILGHPKVARVWSFDRRKDGSLIAWLKLMDELRQQQFDDVFDLHSTLRTLISKIYFGLYSSRTRWSRLSKERSLRMGYETFKRMWPLKLRPTHMAKKSALLVGGRGDERADLRWLTTNEIETRRPWVALVPSSAWRGKEWPTHRYLEWITEHHRARPGDEFVLLGTLKDSAAIRLRDRLLEKKLPFQDALGKFPLVELATVLQKCTLVVGADTGLMHLAEAVGTPVVTVFGPTRSDFGFGPSRLTSQPVETSLWCSPCSKDGTLCFRPSRRFRCLTEVSATEVESAVKKIFSSDEKFAASLNEGRAHE